MASARAQRGNESVDGTPDTRWRLLCVADAFIYYLCSDFIEYFA